MRIIIFSILTKSPITFGYTIPIPDQPNFDLSDQVIPLVNKHLGNLYFLHIFQLVKVQKVLA